MATQLLGSTSVRCDRRGCRAGLGGAAGSSRGRLLPRAPPRPLLPRRPLLLPPPHKPSSSRTRVWPFDQAWGTAIDTETLSQVLPQNLFAVSIIPYAGFLYHLTKSKQAPPLTLFGFYFLLVFVFGTIPAGIYAKTVYGTSLANVDWLHGSAEFLLTLTNLFIVLGLRQGIRAAKQQKAAAAASAAEGQQAAAAAGGQGRREES